MALTVPDVGEVVMLASILKTASPNPQTLKLYSAVSPAIGEGTVVGNFTEATFTGYASKALTRATWPTPTTSSGTTSSSYPQQTWSPTSAQVILGYYVIENGGGADVLWCEAFASSRSLQNGDTLNFTPYIELA